jgi:homospermidine synthase
MIQNPRRGVLLPEDLPHDFVLDISRPYLGNFISAPSDWTPLKDLPRTFEKYSRRDFDFSDPWQFRNFLVKDGD